MTDFYVVAVCHTNREHEYVTLWRPDDRGYTPVLPRAGKYDRANIEAHLGYYNGGDHIAIPCAALDALAVEIPNGYFDYAGPGIPNTRAAWDAIKKAIAYATQYPVKPTPKFERDQFGRFRRMAKAA